jgi:beta-phosphoglucomutase
MNLKGAIFDLDGVLVNTVPLHFKAWKKMFNEYGHKFEMEDYLLYVDGKPRMDGARAILKELSEEDLKTAASKKQEYYKQLLREDEIEKFPSSIELAQTFKKKGIKRAVASSSKNTLAVLEKAELMDLFDAIVTGNDFKRGKPDPEIFLTAAKRIGLPSAECIVFEDAKAGVEAGKNGGFFTIGINRHDKAEELKVADIVVDDLNELPYDKIIEIIGKK